MGFFYSSKKAILEIPKLKLQISNKIQKDSMPKGPLLT